MNLELERNRSFRNEIKKNGFDEVNITHINSRNVMRSDEVNFQVRHKKRPLLKHIFSNIHFNDVKF